MLDGRKRSAAKTEIAQFLLKIKKWGRLMSFRSVLSVNLARFMPVCNVGALPLQLRPNAKMKMPVIRAGDRQGLGHKGGSDVVIWCVYKQKGGRRLVWLGVEYWYVRV